LLQHDVHLVSIGRGPGVQIDHGGGAVEWLQRATLPEYGSTGICACTGARWRSARMGAGLRWARPRVPCGCRMAKGKPGFAPVRICHPLTRCTGRKDTADGSFEFGKFRTAPTCVSGRTTGDNVKWFVPDVVVVG